MACIVSGTDLFEDGVGVIGGSPSWDPSALGTEKKAAASSSSWERDSSDAGPGWSREAAPMLAPPGADWSAAPLNDVTYTTCSILLSESSL